MPHRAQVAQGRQADRRVAAIAVRVGVAAATGAKLSKEDVAVAIRALLSADNVVMNRPAVESGLALLEAGGDFADGIMAHEGRWLGGEVFVSFDKRAVALLSMQGVVAKLLM